MPPPRLLFCTPAVAAVTTVFQNGLGAVITRDLRSCLFRR